MRRVRWSVVVVGIVLALFACSKSKVPAAGASADQKITAPTGNRILNFALSAEPEYLDPGMVSDADSIMVVHNLFERLLISDPETSSLIPGAAESWEVSDDRLTYTFHLRKRAKWSDGKPVTAHDFVYAWERVLNPKTGAKYSFALHYIKNGKAYNSGELTDASELGMKALDDYTLQVELARVTPYFLDLVSKFAYSPVPRWVIEDVGEKWTLPKHIVSNGPFVLTEWTPYKRIVLAKNVQHWYAAHIDLDGVYFMPIENRETAYKMYESGELDIAWNVPEIRIPQLMGRRDFVMHPYLAADFFRVNTTRKPFDNKLVRQALALAIDNETLCDKYLRKMKVPSNVMVPVGVGDYQSPMGQQFDPDKAKALLKEAGYENPKDLGVIDLHYNTDETLKLVAQVVQQMWQEYLGVEVKLFNEEYKSHLKTMKAKEYDISRSRWIGDYVDPNTYLELFASNSSINRTGWANAEYDALLAAAAKEIDTSKRFTILQEAEALLLDEAPVIPLYIHTKAYLMKRKVRGFMPHISDLHELRFVYLKE